MPLYKELSDRADAGNKGHKAYEQNVSLKVTTPHVDGENILIGLLQRRLRNEVILEGYIIKYDKHRHRIYSIEGP
jgi:hypothetical protein